MLRRAGWFQTDVSGLYICPIFKGRVVQKLDSSTFEDRTDMFVPKRRLKTNLRCVIPQNMEELSSTATEAYDLA